jgi:hypothetical protein
MLDDVAMKAITVTIQLVTQPVKTINEMIDLMNRLSGYPRN